MQSYLGQVATRARTSLQQFIATNKQFRGYTFHFVRDAIASLQVEFPNFYVNSSFVEAAPGADATIMASIEYPIGTIAGILKFGGNSAGSIPNGARLLSDPLAVSIPNGGKFRVRWLFQSTAGLVYSAGANGVGFDTANGDAGQVAVSGLADPTADAAIVVPTATPSLWYGPSAIVAQTKRRSYYLLGDSRVAGLKDTYSGTSGDYGSIGRSIGPQSAYINAGCASDRASYWLASNAQRLAAAAYCSDVIIELGINDAFDASRTDAQIRADLMSIASLLPGKRLFNTTMEPESTSNDSWATVSGQTVKNVVNDAMRRANNAWRRSVPSPFSGCFEIADVVESTRDSGLWKAPGYTSDGIHENNLAYVAIQNSGNVAPPT